jgi:UDP-N-acetylglucosamine 1-carboxyvinyltransferase
MIEVLRCLGATVEFDALKNYLKIDTRSLIESIIPVSLMKKMRASVLVMGPLLARFGRVKIALPGGCTIGARPVNFHMQNFRALGAQVIIEGHTIFAHVKKLQGNRIVLEYPSVGATENALMAATLASGSTVIINAALEPEVLNLIEMLKAMGAHIAIRAPNTILIEGVTALKPTCMEVIPDRLEAGSLLLAAAITGGSIYLPKARPDHLDVFLLKLEQMGHTIERGKNNEGIRITATNDPQAVSFTTAQYPGFPTDLQAPLMAALTVATGESIIHEAVFENRLIHVKELQKMGANITIEGDRAFVKGVCQLNGCEVIASDIRASCALVLAGLVAHGTTHVFGIQHWRRGYEKLDEKLFRLGAKIRGIE